MLKRMRDYGAIEELTQAEDDVCFSYLLKGQTRLWKLELSMVGPFAIFVRLQGRVHESDFIGPKNNNLTTFEQKIRSMLLSAGINLMGPKELSVTMPMTLFNTPKTESNVPLSVFVLGPFAAMDWSVAASKFILGEAVVSGGS